MHTLYIVFIVSFGAAFLIGGLVGFGVCLKAGELTITRLTFANRTASLALEHLDCAKIVAHGLPNVASKVSYARVILDSVVNNRGTIEQQRTLLGGNPHRVDCSWCGATMTRGVEPVSHGCCDRCLPDVLAEIELEGGRRRIGDNGPAPDTRPQLPPRPPRASA